ncbi:MAG: hypothetical protein F6K47_04240 [Symploca sp. SIO2E6]|nr:hypothetical protein [Symploca sp. SIO2E6]
MFVTQQDASDGTSGKAAQKRRRRSFLEIWKETFTKAEEAKSRQHFAHTDDQAFNTLLKFLGENLFNVIVRENLQGANWITQHKYPTPPRNLQEMYHDKNLIVGMRFNILTQVLIIDLDRGSLYHPYNDFPEYRRLLGILEDMGLVGVEVVQSSFSEGIHLYIPLPKPVPSWLAAHALYVVLSKAKFRIVKGHLEIFPNRKGYSPDTIINYNGIRLPLQPGTGSYVLDSLTLAPVHGNLNLFVKHLKHHARRQDMVAFRQVMEGAYEDFGVSSSGFVKGRNGSAAEWHNDLLVRLSQGWTGDAQTNDLVFEAVKEAYVFQKLDGEELVERTAAYMRSLPGYKQYCGHQHNLEQRVRDWLKSTKNLGYYPYTGEYRPRSSSPHYGSTVALTSAAGHEDGRKHNPANAARVKESRSRLAHVERLIRKGIREKSITGIPQTISGVMDFLSKIAKEELGTGFSRAFLQKYKESIERLRRFAERCREKIARERERVAAEKPSVERPEPAPVEESLAFCGKAGADKGAQSSMAKGITGNRDNNEGGGHHESVSEVPQLSLHERINLYRSSRTILRYTGRVASNLVQVLFSKSTSSRFQCRSIEPGDLVQLTDEVHSREDRDGMVCVKLVQEPPGEQWLGSIFVQVDKLVPV